MSQLVFGPRPEMAFFTQDFERLTPYMPLDGYYIGEATQHGRRVYWVGVRDFDDWSWYDVCVNIVADVQHRIAWRS
jgi:hypothetical protein